MADVYWNGNVNANWVNVGNWEDNGGAPYGSAPLDGDEVHFLIGRLGGFRCVNGPAVAAPATLISITDDAGYGAGLTPEICWGSTTVTTVTCLSDTEIAGGAVATANLTANGAVITGGAFGAVILNGNAARVLGGTIETLNINGANDYANSPVLNCTTTYINGAGAYIDQGTYGTVYLNGAAAEVRDDPVITTLYVDSLDGEVSATCISAGNITNGPYMMNREAVLYDWDTGLVMCDTTQVLEYGGGRW